MHKDCSHSPLSESNAMAMLSNNGLNRTRGKIKILQEISKSPRPLSVSEIHSLLNETCDLSTVFRTITQFKEKCIINEVNLGEGFFRYELAPYGHEHHHHVRCRKCGDIKNIEHCDLVKFERAISKLGFKEMEHKLEFTAVCSKCSRK